MGNLVCQLVQFFPTQFTSPLNWTCSAPSGLTWLKTQCSPLCRGPTGSRKASHVFNCAFKNVFFFICFCNICSYLSKTNVPPLSYLNLNSMKWPQKFGHTLKNAFPPFLNRKTASCLVLPSQKSGISDQMNYISSRQYLAINQKGWCRQPDVFGDMGVAENNTSISE